MHLIDKDLILRKLVPADAESIAKHANNFNVWINLTDAFPHPYSIEDAEIFIDLQSEISPIEVWAIVYQDEAIGTIGFNTVEENGHIRRELGYWIGEAYWNKGIVTTAVKAVVDISFQMHPEMNEISAFVFTYNPASAKVLEKSGFLPDNIKNKTIPKAGKEESLLCYTIKRGHH
jgi:RimJ/RimL family protein N-acetyltransferase